MSAVGAPPPPPPPTVVEAPELEDSAECVRESTRTTFRRVTTTVRRSRPITRRFHCPDPESISCDTGAPPIRPEPAKPGYAPVLVLCDATRASDSETLLSTISQRRRATMMGITSCWMIGLETTGRCDDMAALGAHREVLIVGRLNPMRASVRTRSALAAAVVMTVCLAIAGGVLLLVLYRSLESTAQGAAAARAEQISAQLRTDTPRELDPSLLVTDSQVGAVQIVDESGSVLAASNGAPPIPAGHHDVERRAGAQCGTGRRSRAAVRLLGVGPGDRGSRRDGDHPGRRRPGTR